MKRGFFGARSKAVLTATSEASLAANESSNQAGAKRYDDASNDLASS
jgi:hypothetical protein